MQKFAGLALITLLIFLQIFALLSLFGMQMTGLQIKESQYVWHRHAAFIASEYGLRSAEEKLKKSLPFCMIPIKSTAELKKQPLNWWQASSCTGNFQSLQYYYVVEMLGEDPCAVLQTPQLIANYYRVTLLGKRNNVEIFLQSTVVTPKQRTSLICEKDNHQVTAGRQMLRQY